MSVLEARRIPEPRFLLAYSALQFAPQEMAKPDGSLSLPYLAGALRRAGHDVRILDVSVGTERDDLADSFFRSTRLASGLLRCGLSRERIAEEMAEADVIGVSSIFTAQTSMVLELVRIAKELDPGKLVVAGGVNARSLRARFFAAGVDLIATSEAERTIVALAEALRRGEDPREIGGLAYLDERGREVLTPPPEPVSDLDELAEPAWDLLPNAHYWAISRPHGGQFPPDATIRYGALQTSRGCPFRCRYCHISSESDDGVTGGIARLRLKSEARVARELETLAALGVEHVFFEDDSLLARKKRAMRIFRAASRMGLELADVNGVNLVHLLRRSGERLVVDEELLECMAEAGFRWLHLPFESGSQRLLDAYSSSKWVIEATPVEELLRSCERIGIHVAGNYIIGHPDETVDEIHTTVRMAKRHVELGLNHAAIFAFVPFPGSAVHEEVLASGQLDPGFDPDDMKWTRSILRDLCLPSESLEALRQMAWLTVNRSDFVDYKIAQRVTPA